jgi:formate dehydrogenase iron-sulfur subunit
MKSYAILTDVTKCIGCEECVAACQRTNETGEDAPWKWQDDATALSAHRWTTLRRTREGRWVRDQCRHCLEPACVAACPVAALYRTPEGAVVYNPDICLGCRYCILACSFRDVRFEYGSANPRVGKCMLCYEKLQSGELQQPACTAACPTGATIFGEREAMLAEAHRRIKQNPGLYLDHVWGEHDAGGTSVLTISDVDLVQAGWPAFVTDEPLSHLTHTIMGTVPYTFLAVGLGLAGIGWVIQRRMKLAAESAAEQENATPPGTASGDEDANEERP